MGQPMMLVGFHSLGCHVQGQQDQGIPCPCTRVVSRAKEVMNIYVNRWPSILVTSTVVFFTELSKHFITLSITVRQELIPGPLLFM